LIGGVLIILSVYLAALLLAKTLKGMLELLSPVAAQIPTVERLPPCGQASTASSS
jgi:hypothetical protein